MFFLMTDRHERQRDIWDDEHRKPFMFPFLSSSEPNPGVVLFWGWLRSRGGSSHLRGLEVCCGKGRNTIWLAGQGVAMSGFDFSEVAIAEAERRIEGLSLPADIDFRVHDATAEWPYPDNSFDFVIDCFGSSDIESHTGRTMVLDESLRVLTPGGYHFLQIDTPEMGFFAQRMKEAPGPDQNTLVFPNGKIEAVLRASDLEKWEHPLRLIDVRAEIETTLEIFGQSEPYRYYWIIAQKPASKN